MQLLSSRCRQIALSWLLLPAVLLGVDNATVQNTTYTTTQTVTAGNSITATPAVIVANGANITFHAGGRATLGAGFKVELGGLFRIKLGQGLPYYMGFESADGIGTGSMHDQLGWRVAQGTAEVVTSEYQAGARSLALQAGAAAAVAGTGFVISSSPNVTFLDLYFRPVAATAAADSARIMTESAKVGFQTVSGQGEVYAFDGVGANQWVGTGYRFNLNGSNQATGWLHLTLRLDYTAKAWDLFADGKLVDYDLAFTSNSETFLRQLSLQGVMAAAAYADGILASDTNPLFTDADKDGMDDTWESANGLNPAANDRNGNLDGDAYTNISEYFSGTKANNADVTKPSPPTGLAVVSMTVTTLGLSWTAPSDTGAGTPGIAGYHVYRGATKLNTTLVTSTTYTDSGYNPSTAYAYTVQAVDLAGNISDASTPLAVPINGPFELFTPLP